MEESRETIEMWETLRILWASGQYCTLGALHRKSVELYAAASPTIGAIRRRADREMWMNDDALSESISEESKRTATEILNDLGMGISRRLEILTDIIRAPHEDHDRIKTILDQLFQDKGNGIDEKTFAAAIKDLKALYGKGMELSLKALLVAGQYAGDIGKGATTASGAIETPLDDKTPEEIELEIDRMVRAKGYIKAVDTTDI
jgi:hypothetical protein